MGSGTNCRNGPKGASHNWYPTRLTNTAEDRWLSTRHPQHHWRTKPYLADNRRLAEKFREHFCRSVTRLHRKGLIAFEPPLLPGVEEPTFDEWADQLPAAFNVFIEPPPENSQPPQVLKYLARYLSGGPIADGRLISHQNGQVTFWARSRNKRSGNRPRPFTLSGAEFVRRWSLHILPPGFTKTRGYGGFSCRQRHDYLQRCRRLLQLTDVEDEPPTVTLPDEDFSPAVATCPRCQGELLCIASTERPSWRELFADHATCPPWYQPALSVPRRVTPRIRSPDSPSACSL